MKPLNVTTLLCLLVAVSCSEDKDIGGNATLSPDREANNKWSFLNPEVFELSTSSNGDTTLLLKKNALWFHGSQGGLMYREVSGDFSFRATVKNTLKTGSQFPSVAFSFGGLMAYNPQSTRNNYVHIVTGAGASANPAVEVKTTLENESEYYIHHDFNSFYDLRMDRKGNRFFFYSRPARSEEEWEPFAVNFTSADHFVTREDFPEELWVGFNIYTASSQTEPIDMKLTISNAKLITAN